MTFSPEVKRRILERSDGLCERTLPSGRRCLAPVVEIHHIVAKKMGGRKGVMREAINDERNGMAVCRCCHDAASLWDSDAAVLVPGADFRAALRTGGDLARYYSKEVD